MRVSDNTSEDSGKKVFGQKNTNRLSKELVEVTMAMQVAQAVVDADAANFQERATINLKSAEVDLLWVSNYEERVEVGKERGDDELMAMDLTGMNE